MVVMGPADLLGDRREEAHPGKGRRVACKRETGSVGRVMSSMMPLGCEPFVGTGWETAPRPGGSWICPPLPRDGNSAETWPSGSEA